MPSVLLIISGSIAAYKSLELIRRLRERDIEVNCILTRGGEQFITKLSVSSLTGKPTYGDLFSLKDEVEMGHIRLSREADLVIVAPASADIIAKMANGIADDLATATLLASNKKLLVAPAMNPQMWSHPATQRNLKQVEKDGAMLVNPGKGAVACGEYGEGRMAEVTEILAATLSALKKTPQSGRKGDLSGFSALVTSGPTHEAIDPVRFIGNRSSGKQGYAIAEALAEAGAEVTLVSGPTSLADLPGVEVIRVTSAEEMLKACESALPVDVAVFAAAVSDWKSETPAAQKIKKQGKTPALSLVENPDILKRISSHKKRPSLVIGFAAETENLLKNAQAKLKEKNCDWIVANDVSGGRGFDADDNEVTLVSAKSRESWKRMSKKEVAKKLVNRIGAHFIKTGKRSA